MSIIRKKFVEHILKEEGRRFIRNQGREIRAKLNFHTHRLIQDRKEDVQSADSMDGQLTITVPDYARLLDLRKNTRGKNDKRRTRKGYQIYNRFAFGHYYGIAFRLQHDFTDEVRIALKKQWEKGDVESNG